MAPNRTEDELGCFVNSSSGLPLGEFLFFLNVVMQTSRREEEILDECGNCFLDSIPPLMQTRRQSMKFGRFLVQNGTIQIADLLEALDEQMDRQTRLGKLALQSRKMSVAEVAEVLDYLADYPGDLFGQVAVSLGYLSELDLADLLIQQRNTRPHLGEILVDLGHMTPETLLSELERFQEQAQPV